MKKKNRILVVSDYPSLSPRKGLSKNHGIAWYTKKYTQELVNKYDISFEILAEKLQNNNVQKDLEIKEKNISVKRVFDKHHPSLFPTILKELYKRPEFKIVHVHSEFCANGSIKNLLLLLPFLLMIRFNGKRVIYFMHNVIDQIDTIGPHVNINGKSIQGKIINFGLPWYYKMIALISNKIVVMDPALKRKLDKHIRSDNVVTAPFKISSRKHTKKNNLPKNIKSNDTVLLFFGFLTYYKGADWIVNNFNSLLNNGQLRKNTHLVLAGGPAYSMKDKPHYKSFYNQILQTAEKNNNIHILGFVEDSNIAGIFSRADVIVFPYRAFMGASGVLNFSLSFNKPSLYSEPFTDMFKDNIEYKDILPEIEKYTFKLNKGSFEKAIRNFLTNKSHAKETSKTIRNLLNKQTNIDLLFHETCTYETNAKTRPVFARIPV